MNDGGSLPDFSTARVVQAAARGQQKQGTKDNANSVSQGFEHSYANHSNGVSNQGSDLERWSIVCQPLSLLNQLPIQPFE